jgi:hypothetical protein
LSRSTDFGRRRDAEAIDAVAQHAEERREQRERRGDRDDPTRIAPTARLRMIVVGHDQHPEHRDRRRPSR